MLRAVMAFLISLKLGVEENVVINMMIVLQETNVPQKNPGKIGDVEKITNVLSVIKTCGIVLQNVR